MSNEVTVDQLLRGALMLDSGIQVEFKIIVVDVFDASLVEFLNCQTIVIRVSIDTMKSINHH